MVPLRFQNLAPLPAGGRLRVVDELKGWAMLLVILYHTGGIFGWGNWLHGETGVDVFLIVSGFTLARNSRDLPWRDFVKRRLLRIYPAYWLALAFFLLLNRYYFSAHYSTVNIVLHVLGLQGFDLWHGEVFSAINDSFWFISMILLMYGIFLGVRKHLRDLGFILGVSGLLTAVTCWIYVTVNHPGGLSQLAVRVPSFFTGLLAAQLLEAGPTEFKVSPLLAAGAVALTYLGWTRSIIPFYALAGPAMILGFLVLRESLSRHPDGRFLLKGFALLGVYSYEIFLFHQPLIRDYNRVIWSRYFEVTDPSASQLALGWACGLLVTFVLSFAVHHLTARLFAARENPVARPMNSPSPELPVAILAGGLAKRLRPITEKIPKLLVEVAGEPFFSHQIRLLKKSGLTHLVLCVGHLGEKIVELYGDGSRWGMKIEYSFDGQKLLGTGGALIQALPKLGDAFYMLYGDSYLPIDYPAVGNFFRRSGRLGLMTVYENHERYDASNVWFENGEIKIYDKQHKVPQMRHIDYGLGVFRAAAFDGWPRDAVVDLAEVQQALVARQQLAGYEISQRFYEVGSHAGLNELDALLRDGKLP